MTDDTLEALRAVQRFNFACAMGAERATDGVIVKASDYDRLLSYAERAKQEGLREALEIVAAIPEPEYGPTDQLIGRQMMQELALSAIRERLGK